MDFELSELQQMIVDSAQRLITAETGLEQWRARRELPDGVNAQFWAKMAELGWMALAVPEDAGGLGSPMEDVALLMIELGKGLVTEPLISTGILAAHIFDSGLEGDGRETWLAQIAAGEAQIALAYEEPQSVNAAGTKARRDGAGFVLEGQKIMAFDAPSADHLLVTADFDGKPAIFIVPSECAGMSMKAYALIDGSRAADLTFSAVALPADAMIASGERAEMILGEALDRARVATIAQAVGVMEVALLTVADYAKERQQFGQPIGKFQAIQHLASDMFVSAYQARSSLYAALRDIEGSATVRARAVSVAKVVSGMAGQTVSRNGIQIHGGYGVTDEYAISHYYRRLLVLEKQYGGIDAHAALLADVERQGDPTHRTAETV